MFDLKEAQAKFQEDGVVLFKQLLSKEEVQLLVDGANETMKNPSHRSRIASTKNDPGNFFEDFCMWNNNSYYEKVIRESKLAEIACQLMNSKKCRFFHDHFLVKEPGTTTRTPFHQDQPYYNISGNQNCSFWIPLDKVARESTLEFISGSFKGPVFHPYVFIDKKVKELESKIEIENDEEKKSSLVKELEKLKLQIESYKEIDKAILNENKNNNTNNKEEESKKKEEEINNDDNKDSVLLSIESNIPDIENNRENFPILGWEMEPGDVVCFHMKTLHGAGGVSVNQNRRRVYVARFMGDDTRFEPKYYSSPIWPELEKELKEGDEMNHSLFPIIFESEK